MKKIVLVLALVCATACASLPHTADGRLDLPKLLTWAQYGIDADCSFGSGGLAQDVCTFGHDAIATAQAAWAKDPANGFAAAKKVLMDAVARQPKFGWYVGWLIQRL